MLLLSGYFLICKSILKKTGEKKKLHGHFSADKNVHLIIK